MKNMKLRRMLLETDPPGVKSTQVAGVTAYQNPLMKVAINAGCFTKNGFISIREQGGVAEGFFKDFSKEKPELVKAGMPHLYLIPNSDGQTFKLSYRSTDGVEKSSQPIIVCKEMEKTTNPTYTDDQAAITKFLKNYGFDDYASVTNPQQQLNSTLVDISTDPYAQKLLKGNELFNQQIKAGGVTTLWMWKGNQTIEGKAADVQNKGKLAQDWVDYLKKSAGFMTEEELPFDKVDDYTQIDLSKPEQYTGTLEHWSGKASYFTGPYILYRPISLTKAEGGQMENKETCRQKIIDYWNLMKSSDKKTPDPNQKLKVEKCLWDYRGQYPKLKNYIDQLMYPGEGKKGYAIANRDYTTKPGGGVFSSSLKESNDVQLKNIISENLTRLKKKIQLTRRY